MPRGDKNSYTAKQQRKAEHIEDSYRERGVGKREAEERAWRTVNKQDGGAKKKRPAPRARKSKGSTTRRRPAAKRKTRARSRSRH